MKRYRSILIIKSTDSFNQCEVADPLWIYVAINGSMYRGTATEMILGELGWFSIRKQSIVIN